MPAAALPRLQGSLQLDIGDQRLLRAAAVQAQAVAPKARVGGADAGGAPG